MANERPDKHSAIVSSSIEGQIMQWCLFFKMPRVDDGDVSKECQETAELSEQHKLVYDDPDRSDVGTESAASEPELFVAF